MGRVQRAVGVGFVAALLGSVLPACGPSAHPASTADAADALAPAPDVADVVDAPPSPTDVAGVAADAADAPDAGPPCPAGQVRGLDGVCFPAGIQGCAPMFFDDEGLCDPSMSKCPPGTIPKFDEGCVPVGIQGCAERFMEEDGLCHPRMDKCPAGTIPKFDEGCVPVGIQGCAALFMEDDGLCHPRMEKCPAGTIPKFDEGCVPVGIQGCAEVFLEEDGLCHPSMDKCPEDTFAVPQEGCVPIDGPDGCGEGTWGNIGPGPDTYYVDPAYAGDDGDGSRERPGRTIAAVLPLVPEGGRLVLAAGTYDEPLHLTTGIEVVGRCPSMVTITGVQDAYLPTVVWVEGAANAAVRSLTITGDGSGVLASDVVGLTVERVRVRAAATVGIYVLRSEAVHLDHVLVAHTRPHESGAYGRGLNVQGVSRVTVTGSAFVGNRDAGILVLGEGAVVEASGDLVEATDPPSDGMTGYGVSVTEGARAVLSDCALMRNHAAAIFAHGQGSEVEARGSLAAGTRPRPFDDSFGVGILMEGQASGTLLGNAVIDNRDAGLSLREMGDHGTVTGNLVAGTRQPETSEGNGYGISISGGGPVRVEGNALTANHTTGLVVADGAVVEAVGNLVEGTLPDEPNAQFGFGILIEGGSDVALHGNAVVGNLVTGVVVSSPGTSGDLTGNLVENTSPRLSDGDLGEGLAAWDGVYVRADGNAFVSNTAVGLALGPDVEIEATGNLVTGTRSTAASGAAGFGIQASGGSVSLTLAHNAIVANRLAGLSVFSGTDLTATGNLVEDTRGRASDGGGGVGIALFEDATASLSGNAVVANRYTGLWIAGAEADVSGNLVESTVPSEDTPGSGTGVQVRAGVAATLTRNAILTSRGAGLVVSDEGTWAEAIGNLVADTRASTPSRQDGAGWVVLGLARARLVGNAIVHNRISGLIAAESGTQVEVDTSLVEGTLPSDSDGTWGLGVAAQDGASLTLTSCAVRENHVASIFVDRAEATVSECALLDTRFARVPLSGGREADVADGLIAQFSHLALAGTFVSGCGRAGILIAGSTGTITRTVSRDSAYGLVFQGTPFPELGEGNVFTGNSEAETDPNGALPVPANALPLPQTLEMSP